MNRTDITLQNISKSYGDTSVLSDLSLTFAANGTYCLMAPSGTGKTTLLKILMGLVPADSGTIYGLNHYQVSAVFQENRLLENYSALQNIRFVTGNRYSNAALLQKLTLLLPEDCLSQPVSELSGGMKRRLCILRALLAPFDLLLMDEPFTGLDSGNRQKAIRLIRETTVDKLLIAATHNPGDAALLNAEIIHL